MKQGIHPEYNEINVIWTDGTITKTRSTYAKGDLRLDIDPTTHMDWFCC
jgi:large subunit ribosomal protein L31